MRIITQGLTEAQRLEAVTKAARVDERRAHSMLAGAPWDAVVVDGSVVMGPSVYDVLAERKAPSEAAGVLVALKAHAGYGEVRTIGDSGATILVTAADANSALVPH